jgi:hypothetical protein
MLYWFQRGKELLHLETCSMRDAYELAIVAPNGREKVERFANKAALEQREAALQNELSRAGWDGPHDAAAANLRTA